MKFNNTEIGSTKSTTLHAVVRLKVVNIFLSNLFAMVGLLPAFTGRQSPVFCTFK